MSNERLTDSQIEVLSNNHRRLTWWIDAQLSKGAVIFSDGKPKGGDFLAWKEIRCEPVKSKKQRLERNLFDVNEGHVIEFVFNNLSYEYQLKLVQSMRVWLGRRKNIDSKLLQFTVDSETRIALSGLRSEYNLGLSDLIKKLVIDEDKRLSGELD